MAVLTGHFMPLLTSLALIAFLIYRLIIYAAGSQGDDDDNNFSGSDGEFLHDQIANEQQANKVKLLI